MNNEYDFLKKQRYKYYKGTKEIMDNELNKLVEDVVDVLNQKAYNINELLKIKQFQSERIAELEEQLKKFTEPQKVKFNKFNGYRGTRFKCPNCNKQIENCIDYTADYYCKHCGQRVVYPKFRVVNNIGELYFEEAQAKLQELQGEKLC